MQTICRFMALFMIFCGNCPFSTLQNMQKSNCWFYLMPSLEPILKSVGENGWFQSHFSAAGLAWNNFAEHFGEMAKNDSLRNLIV